jgi:hypothetical protein
MSSNAFYYRNVSSWCVGKLATLVKLLTPALPTRILTNRGITLGVCVCGGGGIFFCGGTHYDQTVPLSVRLQSRMTQ